MDIHRAKQIVSSPKEEINVHYHGVPIWIKNCNEINQTVSLYTKDNPDNVMIVPVNELEEV